MKRLLLTLAVSLTALLPFSLRAEEAESTCVYGSFEVSDFSAALGNEVFADYMYEFFNRFADLLAGMDARASQLITLFPGEPISLSWEKDMECLRDMLEDRDTKIKVLSFVGAGIYPDSNYDDESTREDFHSLQNLIFTGLVKDLMIIDAYEEERISEETYEKGLAAVEAEIMEKTKALCLESKDHFFTDELPEFLGDAASRLEALSRFLPVDDEDEYDGESKAEMAFEELEDALMDQLDELVHEMFSIKAIEELCHQMMNGVEEPIACESQLPESQTHANIEGVFASKKGDLKYDIGLFDRFGIQAVFFVSHKKGKRLGEFKVKVRRGIFNCFKSDEWAGKVLQGRVCFVRYEGCNTHCSISHLFIFNSRCGRREMNGAKAKSFDSAQDAANVVARTEIFKVNG